MRLIDHIEVVSQPAADPEYWLQYALGKLVSCPIFLERTLRMGVQITLDYLPIGTLTIMESMLSRHERRFRIIAKMLDERLLRNVLRFLPLTGAAANSVLPALWTTFRFKYEGIEWKTHRDCAIDFCANVLADEGQSEKIDRFFLDIFQYEYAILLVDGRAKNLSHPILGVNENWPDTSYPEVLVKYFE